MSIGGVPSMPATRTLRTTTIDATLEFLCHVSVAIGLPAFIDVPRRPSRRTMMNVTKKHRFMLGAAAIVTAGFVTTVGSQAAEQLLSGTITSASGEKMAGVTVSAKRVGSTIATHVYTDEQGNYYFPAMEAGKYRVWAQALSYEAAKSEVDLAAAKKQDLVLQPMTDQERRW